MKRLTAGNFPKHQDIEGMSRVGYAGDLEVYVNTDDGGSIPHIHIRDPKDWSRFHSCVKLEKAEYFLHEGKEDLLNAKQRKQLQEFMESTPDKEKYRQKFDNNWEMSCFFWEINNSNTDVPEGTEMPNYRNLLM